MLSIEVSSNALSVLSVESICSYSSGGNMLMFGLTCEREIC